MKKEFIPYDEALSLKKLGFDEPCFGFYEKLTKELNIQGFQTSNSPFHNQYICKTEDNLILAPLFQQAFKFFRDKYKLYIEPSITEGGQGNEDWYYFAINEVKHYPNWKAVGAM
jgi:hypothetical protein